MLGEHPGAVGIATVLLSGVAGHYPVVWFLAATGFLRPSPPGTLQFARWIGVFERFAITLFVLVDSFGAAAFIFGIKTAVMSVRVANEDRPRDIVEYILLGTFVSFVVAVAFGLLGRWLLGLPVVGTGLKIQL
jgi:hypothetical protein